MTLMSRTCETILPKTSRKQNHNTMSLYGLLSSNMVFDGSDGVFDGLFDGILTRLTRCLTMNI